MKPPFQISATILDLVGRIERLLGQFEAFDQPKPQPHLRKANRVRTIHGSLAIEGNSLSLDQVTALLEGKRVVAKQQDILEILNANKVYNSLAEYKPFVLSSLLKAHGDMMHGLIPSAGKWRRHHERACGCSHCTSSGSGACPDERALRFCAKR